MFKPIRSIVAPNPGNTAAVKTNLSLLVNSVVEMILIPLMATRQKRKLVIPPSTGLGIDVMAPANLANTPITIKKNAPITNFLLAHFVIEITPLF